MKTEGLFIVDDRRVETRAVELADPGPGTVQIELQACGLCKSDLHFFTGRLPLEKPALVGHEGVGVVSRLGPQVEGLATGDLVTVAAGGLFARFANCPVGALTPLPSGAEPPEHWLGEPVACVVNALDQCRVGFADRVVVVGAGFMGLLLIQGLRHEPVRELIALDTRADRRALAQSVGADMVLNPADDKEAPTLERLSRVGADVVFECAGTQDAVALATDVVRSGGRLCIFSWHMEPRTVDLGRWHARGLQVLNVSPASADSFPRLLAPAVAGLRRGIFDLAPLVTHTAPLEDAQRLFETADDAPEGFVKAALLF